MGSAAHACKARKAADGSVAKVREQFEPSTPQALAIVPARRSARPASLRQAGSIPGLPQSHETAPRLLPRRLQALPTSLWQLY